MIAIAEPCDELRHRLCDAVELHGARVVELEDTLELEDYLGFVVRRGAQRGLPDAVVTEAKMPGGTARPVLERARLDGVRCPFLIIASTMSMAMPVRLEWLDDLGQRFPTAELAEWLGLLLP
ncbi:MAG: hypothetical protein U0228_30055 [Myxococcaceae bacterium]